MNFAGGFTIPQENDFQFRSSWIPATPYNPIPVNTQGNQLGRTNWQEQVGYPGGYVQEMQNYNGVVQNLHPKMLLGLSGGLANPDVTLPQRNRGINHIPSNYGQTLGYESAGWNTNTLADILAIKNAASAAAENSTLKRSIHGANRHLSLNLQAQANQNQYQSGTIGMSLANHSCCQSPSLFNNGKSFANTPQDGFPVPYRPNYNLNSPPRTVDGATTSFTNSFFAPVTPDQTKKSENDRLPELLNLSVDESSSVERNKQDNLATSIGSEAIERHNDELLQNIVDSSAAANVTSIREMSKDGDQGIDLNKTPQQKPPKRRKHRPKVVVEGKPKRTPKPATPQNPSSKQNPTGKRKYVCKNGLNASTTKPEDVMGKTIDDPVETAAKSCRRVLDFDLEKTIDESRGNLASQLQHGTERYFNLNLDSHAIEQCNKTDNISGRKSAAQMNQHRVVEREKQEATTRNLTHSRDQLPPNYVAVPNQYVFQAPATTLIDLTTGNLNVIVSNANTQKADPKHTSKRSGYSLTNQQNIHAEGIGQIFFEDKNINASLKRTGQLLLQNSPQSVLPNMAASIEERIFKRKYHPAMEQTHQHNATLNSLLCQEIFQVEYNKHDSNLNEGFSETQKKRKSGSGLTTNLSTFMSSFTAVADDSRRHKKNGSNGVNPNPSTSQINHGVLNSHYESSSTPTKMNNGVHTYIGDWYHAPSQHDFLKQYNSRELLSHTPSAVKMQSNRSTQVNNITSLGMIEKFNYLRYPASDDMKGVGTRNANSSAKEETTGPTLSDLPSDKKPLREHKIVNHNPPSPFTKKGPSKRQKYLISIDEIICQLEGLKLDDKSKESVGQEQNALVPYKADGTIISYKGLHQIKKRRPRPKVNLDPETDRLWRLLMGKEQSEATEGTNKDKEKWWEEERKVFRGRADSFIARMHLVQGDRRFSRWKGSVVDSVIGVFLTQNVSDHLSSSAFMSLAARFPMRSSSNNKTCYKSETSILVEEPEVCILDPDDTLRWSEKVSSQPVYKQRTIISQQSWDHRRENLTLGKERTTLVETNNKRQEEVISTPYFIHPSIQHSYGGTRSFSLSNLEAKEPTIMFRPSKTYGSVSENLLQLEKVAMFQKLHGYGNGSHLLHENFEHRHKQLKDIDFSMHNPMVNIVDSLGGSFTSTNPSHSYNSPVRVPVVTSSNYRLHNTPHSGVAEFGVLEREGISSWPSYDSRITKEKDLYCSINVGPDAESTFNATLNQDELLRQQEMLRLRPSALLNNHRVQQQSSSHPGHFKETNQHSCNYAQPERNKVFQSKSTSITGFMMNVEALSDREKSTLHEDLNAPNLAYKAFEAQTAITNNKIELADKVTKENAKEQNYSSGGAINEKSTTTLKTRKGKVEIEKNSAFDWDGLRKQVQSHSKRERMNDSMDSLDYEAVRCADVNKIAESIRERGMNNMLADRMKDFLNRLVREHGSIDLEWLRDAPPDKAKDYLLSIRGLGLKSVECVRLLTLHHLAFPVDTNVGRIAVRLGWVPLQPLPESLQLHLLEMYPVLESIQKYLWPRLCKLDQRTLYELHYQMITFGKVFCTKSKPNCNACPMRGECRHFASAFASARLALPGPEEKGIVHSSVPIEAERNPAVISNPMPLLPPGEAMYSRGHCEPIIEVPATPEPECTEISESDIEDAFYEDPDEIPTIKLNIEEFTQNLQNYMQENFEVQGGDMSKALVTLNSAAASIPTAKLKNVSRLRTEHQVYELPDSHPLLKGLERREPDDPSPYLLAIWTPGETANSTQPPENQCREQDASKLCNEMTCFSCNSIREANSQTVRGTLLIPCRTAMRGSFPLNGTYFQVNEMFADHDSSLNPIDVPRAWIWNLPRRTVYFGTSVSTIFKGMSTEGIQYCFWRGFVCVRGFDQKMRAPRPLIARLHFPASEVSRTKNEKNDVNAKMQKRIPA